mmetsp:Transcript_32190/g.54568  ORF Transcript_32190/g.54568 Transcript_32190/m.54568 type:complete len:82 (+) Transcript_32190:2273-2518(+)
MCPLIYVTSKAIQVQLTLGTFVEGLQATMGDRHERIPGNLEKFTEKTLELERGSNLMKGIGKTVVTGKKTKGPKTTKVEKA